MSDPAGRDPIFLDVLQEAMEDWISENSRDDEGGRVNRSLLWEELGRACGVSGRQMLRYHSGDTPFPADLIIPLCTHIGRLDIILYLAYGTGATVVRLPTIEDLDEFDLVDELAHNFSKFSRLAESLSKLFSTRPTGKGLAAVEHKTREAVTQMVRCQEIYRLAANAGMFRKRKARKALAAGQRSLFETDEG